MFNKILFVFSTIILCTMSCTQKDSNSQEADGSSAINADSMRMNIAILASDSFEGRKPFTKAEQKTISYIEQQYKNLGLEPGNGNSYLQEVPMVNIKTTAAPTMQVKSAKGNFELKGFDDYVIWTDKSDSSVSFNDNELIFAGYGVVAPEYNRNDYAGLDVKNKIVLILVNDPGYLSGDTTLFKGKTMTYYGRWTYKFEEAARQGAKGCLIIHNTAAASYPFSVVQNNWNSSKLHLDNRNTDVKYSDIIGWVSADAGNKLMLAAGLDTSLLKTAWQPGFKSVPLGIKLSTSIKVESIYDKSHNVIAKIKGSKRPDETIIYTAHWDHLGIGKPNDKGDSIYNGALDNASGVVSLIELARAFKAMKTPPERTIIFLAVTAEEQGLWGSAYYAQNPIYPAAKTVANINMDGITPFEKRKDYVIVGRGQNDLEDYAKDYAAANGKDISFETHPEAGSYYRSDHFNFAKVGIPALYMKSGIDIIGKGKAYGQQKSDEYTKEHYHRPSDEYDAATWHFEGGVEELKLLFAVGRRLAFETTMPKWKVGSEFKKIRND